MNLKLSSRQEIFCNQIFLGKTASDAARIAGYADCNHTTTLLKLVKVQRRLEELRQVSHGITIADAKERRERLSQIYRGPIPGKVTAKEQVLAITEHNRMDRIYEDKEPGIEVIQTFIFILPDGTKKTPRELLPSGNHNERENRDSLTAGPSEPSD